jgi:hypothetical protein
MGASSATVGLRGAGLEARGRRGRGRALQWHPAPSCQLGRRRFAPVASQIRAIDQAGCEWVHIDVMDGRFVPNITIGPLIVEALRPVTDKVLDVHLVGEALGRSAPSGTS